MEEKGKRRFERQFQDALQSLEAQLNVGYSMENAIKEVQRDLQIMYDRHTLIVREFTYMVRQLNLNVTAEAAWKDFAARVALPEVDTFVTVFSLAKRSGGDSILIIKNAVRQLGDKAEVKREIDTVIAAKKNGISDYVSDSFGNYWLYASELSGIYGGVIRESARSGFYEYLSWSLHCCLETWMQDCGNRGIEMWFCIGMYFFLGACAWMYFKKKSLFRKWDRLLRQIFFLMLAVTSLAFLSEIVQKTGTENSETMQIKRNGYGEGQKEAALSMQVEGEKKQDIEIRVSPKIYSEKRLEKEFQKARKELAKVISGENKDLSHIKTDLDLVTALDDFPFSVSWELSRYDVMDSLGRLDQEKIREEDPENQGIGMNITGVLHYEDKVYPCEMDLVIFAGQEKTLSTKERVLELVRLQDSATRQKAYLTLPPSLDGRKIAWTEEKDSKVIPILMLGMAISILLVGREIQKESNRKKTKKEQMMLDYPEIITEFTMLTGAGMTAKNVWKRIAEDYGITRGKTGRKREAYEEIWKTWQEMKSGIPEMECYERFARRCDLIPYMKMGALLSQNLKKGAKGISEMLRMEAVQALEDRKSRARQLGEEAGTRLLIPMLLMLIIVITIVVVPAFLSIQV